MRIGIITVHDSANFGAYLQAYALRKTLQKMGHEVKFIRTRDRNQAKRVFLGGRKNFIKYLCNYKANIEKYNIFMKEVDKFEEIDKDRVNDENIDIIIIGSDELWNVNARTFRNEYFYGINIPIRNKITYAVSVGKASIKQVEEYPSLIKGIGQLNYIMVRDENTKSIVEEVTERKCKIVCDPTLLLDIQEYQTEYVSRINQKYILIYGYTFSKTQKKHIKKFARENNLLIVSACLKHNWSDIHINCTPVEFCELLKDASYIVTTTFHGTIFCILNKKQFISMPTSPKTEDILKRVKKEEVIFKGEEYELFKSKLLQEIDYTETEKAIEEFRNYSLRVLNEILSEYKKT